MLFRTLQTSLSFLKFRFCATIDPNQLRAWNPKSQSFSQTETNKIYIIKFSTQPLSIIPIRVIT